MRLVSGSASVTVEGQLPEYLVTVKGGVWNVPVGIKEVNASSGLVVVDVLLVELEVFVVEEEEEEEEVSDESAAVIEIRFWPTIDVFRVISGMLSSRPL